MTTSVDGSIGILTNLVSSSGNVTGGNILATGAVSATGNVQGSFVKGNGSLLTGIAGGPVWQNVITSNTTVSVGNAYPVNTTSNAVWVTLPSSPGAGNVVILTDYARTWATNNVTVNPNGLKVQGSTSNVSLITNGQSVNLVYVDSTQGWLVYASGNPIGPYSVDYLVVAGGGAGGDTDAGGGGAGGYIATTGSLTPTSIYTIVVGAGAATQAVNWTRGANGSNSSISGFGIASTTTGGGGGGVGVAPASPSDGFGQSGGSGGGAGSTWPSGRTGSGTAGQGYAGGNGGSSQGGGGGGGAGMVGYSAPTSSQAGNGGDGLNWQSLGT